MKVDRIRVGAFGRLQGFDTGPESLGSLVVVLGQNEAGKSTLFTFLTTALYGFSPATRERNPHVPWGADEATGLIRLRLDERGCAEVERTLRSQPTGRLTVDGRTTELRNQALPWVGHVPRSVFRQVFAVTLSELAGLDGETWARIQEKMIGSMGAADLHSARAAAEVLEREAGEIWRPNRRGNQQLRDLRAELRELRGRRAEAKDRDARIRRLVEEREHVRLELRAVREQRHLDRAEVERARSLLPIKRQLKRIAALRTEGGPAEELRDLPANPSESFAELRAELAELSSEGNAIASDIAEREAVIAQAAAGAPLLERSEEILRLVARAAGSAPDRVKAIELEGEIGDVEARLDTAGRATLSESWRTVPAEALGSIATEIIRERIERSKDLAAVRSSRSKSAGLGPLVPLALGLVLLAWGVVAGRTLTSAAGAAAVAAALTWWLAVARSGRGEVDTGGRRGDLSSERALADLLRDVPVRPELIQRPDETLVVGLERLRDLARRHSELSGALESARERVARVDSDAADLATSLGHAGSGDAEAVARDLDRQLRAAERQRDAAAAAARELLRLRRSREGAAARAAELDARLGALSERAETLAGGDLARGLQEAQARLAAHRRADQLEDELEMGHPNLQELRAQIEKLDRAEHSWSVDEQALARARARIEAHDERIEALLTRGESLESEAGHLRELETVDAVDSEIASLSEEERRLVRARDRKWVLARLLREADRRFREEHQPDLVQRAGSYLRHLTGGRYERLVVDETHGEHLFHLVGPTLPAPVPLAPPVSTGTLEQAYLSLRLAIVDHLDQGGERLPLFVDEVFVNWDGERRARGLEVLSGIAASRQVFVFTCHPHVAGELKERGGRVLGLELH